MHGTRLVQSQHLPLLSQILNVLRPILLSPKGRKSTGKGGILMMAQHPGRVTNHAQCPQWLNETQTVAVEYAEKLVGIHQNIEFVSGLIIASRDSKPEILHCRPRTHIIEINTGGHVTVPDEITQVKIAM